MTVDHPTEGNTTVAINLPVAQWRNVHSALRMVGKAREEAAAAGDTGLGPDWTHPLAERIWWDGVVAGNQKLRSDPAPTAQHGCGMCDRPLAHDGTTQWPDRPKPTDNWRCTACDWTHTSRDCCEAAPRVLWVFTTVEAGKFTTTLHYDEADLRESLVSLLAAHAEDAAALAGRSNDQLIKDAIECMNGRAAVEKFSVPDGVLR